MKHPDTCVIIMSKAPVPGSVKTRLVPLLGKKGACELYRGMLASTLDMLSDAALCHLELCCSPDSGHEFFIACSTRHAVSLTAQSGTDLGERMANAIARGLRRYQRVVIIGADCPSLSPEDIESALTHLDQGVDVVLGPASDGGYYLVGMHAPHAGLFDSIPWGGAQVMAATRRQLERLGLSSHLLTVHDDIDTPDDYLAWRGHKTSRRG